ncbi:phosphatidylinositol-specific phospholipase C/glycerophosphodiester phosphodiesterase family protein [Lentzea sp. HUAS TT2]|uniref:phosphatidylinositol-specific phospholipase C/glycerophosphodiester phosphodiesterase family protein n=1 Tax=Lentzea sp. HUAS TT2 TaxID=3447454 RepID=UPI003F6FFE9B
MKRPALSVLLALLVTVVAGPVPAAVAGGIRPLERAHAHNDYEHDRPLADARDSGFTSVEADVWLVDGELRVAHDLIDARPGRTLRSLYLQPLAELVRANRGHVYPHWRGSFQLLVDIKSDGPATYRAVDEALREFRPMLTQWVNGHERGGAVEVVISGNRPREDMLAQRVRLAGYDGRLSDLGSGVPAGFMPLVSDNWTNHFTWQGVGPIPVAEREKLHRIVSQAHAARYRLRFWATPDTAGQARDAVWRELVAAGVDHINTDDLAGLREFLLRNDPAERHGA